VPYATQQDLVDRYGDAELKQLADRNRDGAIEAAVVTRCLADASDTIDSYIGQRYQLPLAAVPPVLKRVCCEIARFLLYADGATEAVAANHEWALGWLKDVAAGKAGLDVSGSEPAAAGGGQVLVSGPDRTFSRRSLRGL